MVLPVKLRDVVLAMEMAGDEMTSYINRQTGKVVTLGEDDISYANEDENSSVPEWQEEIVAEAKEVLVDELYIELPDRFDIHEYALMERFCWSIEDARVRNTLLRAIKGQGAFQRFKACITQESVRENWFAFRDEAFKKIAADFLANEGITFIDK